MRSPCWTVAAGVKIDIWSDIVCPFCYIGKRHLEAALEAFPHRDAVQVVWHSFELDPGAAAVAEQPTTAMLAGKYGMSIEQARESQQQMTAKAAEVGLEFHLEEARSGNTFDAHRLVHLAAGQGLADAAHERLMLAYFTERESIGDHATLARLAADIGLDADRVSEVLAGQEFADAVRRDEQQAAAYGARGVPFFVLADAVGVSGAQPVEVFTQALEQAWAAAHPLPMVQGGGAGDASCDGDTCAV